MAWIPVISRPTISDWMLSVPSKVKTASMSAWWRATWCSSRIPLPPRMSRASATIARALAAWFILASDAMPGGQALVARQLAEAQAQQLHGGDLADHAAELVLHELEGGQRVPELLALLGVGQRRLVGGERDAERAPRHGVAREGQHAGDVAERAAARQPALGRDAHAVQRDLGLPHRAQRGLAGDDLGVEARRALLDEVAADLAVLAARPDDRDVGERRVADPLLGAVEDELVAVAAGARLQRDGVGAMVGLGQAEGADRLQRRHARQPALALLLGAEQVDGLHGEVRVHAEEGPDAAVGPRPLHAHEARRRWRSCPDSRSRR